MLKLVLPKGSLEKATLELFEAADLAVSRSSTVDYRASIEDPRVDEAVVDHHIGGLQPDVGQGPGVVVPDFDNQGGTAAGAVGGR